MKKTLIMLFILFLLSSVSYAEDSEGIAIYKIWAVGDNPDSPKLYINPSNPSLNIGLVNYDPYQRNVKVKAEYGGETWESPLIPLSPNSHYEKIVEIRLTFAEVGNHDVDISLIDENGKEVESDSVTVNVVNPIDVKNITCQDSYIPDATPYVEIVNSNWYMVTLESNARAQTDYEVKTWISVVSKDYNDDSNDIANSNDEDIYYNGKNDAKTVYVPYHSEAEISFKIPELNLEEDEFKIQVHTEVMGLHDYTDGLEETKRVTDDDEISYTYKKTVKKFQFPLQFISYSEFNDINGSSETFVKEFYQNSKIYDEIIENALNDKFINKDILPRAYVTEDPYLAVLKVTLANRYDQKLNANLVIESVNGYKITKSLEIDQKDSETFYLPYLSKLSTEEGFDLVLYSDKNYVYNSEEDLDFEPTIVSPVVLSGIELPNDNSLSFTSNNSGNVLVGKNYTTYVTLKNNYNRTLTGKLYVGNHYNDENTYESGIFESSNPLTFKLAPKEQKTYEINLKFNRELMGLIEFVVETDGVAVDEDDDIPGYSTMYQFNAYNMLDIKKVWYNNTILPKISTISEGGLFVDYPVAGYNNSCVVALESQISEPVTYKMWVDVYDSNGVLTATSKEKTVTVTKRSTNSALQTVDFDIFFEEGFVGYTLFHAIPIGEFEDVEIVYTEGFGTVSREIDSTATVGRYSAIDLLNKVPTSMNKVTEVVSPLKIENLGYSGNNVNAVISSGLSSTYPVNISYYYTVEVIKNNETVYKSPKYYDTIHSTESKYLGIKIGELSDENYEIILKVEIPDFALKSGQYLPITLKKSLKINLLPEDSNEALTENNEGNRLGDELNTENSNSEKVENEVTEEATEEGLISTVFGSIKNIISRVPFLGGLVS